MERLKPIEHKFKAAFFGLFKLFLRKGIKEFKPIDGSAVNKVLFLRPEKIGDMVISLPVFDGLKKHFPHIKISILGSPRNLALIKDDNRFEYSVHDPNDGRSDICDSVSCGSHPGRL